MRHRTTALPLALMAAALVTYASLYPFEGWRWPPGLGALDLWLLPWPPWRDRFDEFANFAGYVPVGALIYGAWVRSGHRAGASLRWTLVLAAALSVGVEVAQQFIPSRVPSLKDCGFNIAGALVGALLAAAVQRMGWIERWQALRHRWFEHDSAVPLVLLLLWPVALLFPTPVPFGVGHVGAELRALIESLVSGTPWAGEVGQWLGEDAAARPTLSRVQEGLIVAIGALAPCLVAFATTHAGWHRGLLMAGALVLGVGATTLSTALNFGPAHALTWWTPPVLPALSLAVASGVALMGVGRRLAAALGLVALAALVALVAPAPADPYYAASLQSWEQGRFIRFHGLAQWVGWLWPFAAMLWLLARLARRGDG
jgi:VanZ family protein